MFRAVLFDIGGPLDLETRAEAAIDSAIRASLTHEGIPFSEEQWHEANLHATEAFAPSLYQAVIWRLTHGDIDVSRRVYEFVEERAAEDDLFELRPGVAEMLATLKQRGLKLGLAANQPKRALEKLQRAGIEWYFDNQGVAGVYGLRKPDVRLFLRACGDLDVEPEECIMVGDRIDNDIVPAKLLGMQTVLIRTGRHEQQQPRSWEECPDAEVRDAAGILQAVERLIKAAPV